MSWRPYRNRCALTPLFALLSGLILVAATPRAGAEEITIQNENLQDGDQGYIVGDFAPHEEAAAWLTVPSDGTIVAVQILWWSIDDNADPTVEENIWIRTTGTFPRPGDVLLQLNAPLMTPFFLNEFRYTDEQQQDPISIPVSAGDTIVVSLEFANGTDIQNGTPSIVRDTSTCKNGKNALFAPNLGGWVNWCQISGGNFVIRAVLETDNQTRTLSVESDQPGSLVDDGNGFRETPFQITGLREGDTQTLTAFPFSSQGDPFVRWQLDGQPAGTDQTITVNMNTGADRTATAIYNDIIDRTLFVESDVPGSLVDAGDGFQPTPFTVATAEGDAVTLRAFGFSQFGDPFQYWELDGQFTTDQTELIVDMNAGADRTARAVYVGNTCAELLDFTGQGKRNKAKTVTTTNLTGGKVTVECIGDNGSGKRKKKIKANGKAKATIKNLPAGDYTCTLKKIKDADKNTVCQGDLASANVTVHD